MGARNRRSTRETTADETTGRRVVRRRPRDRRAQIAAASAEAFGSLGYHGVSMEDIASRLDISSTALYRHYPSKYALFRAETLRLGTLSVEAVRLPGEADQWTAQHRLEHELDALIGASITNRRSAALLRWQRRYLEPDDAALLATQLALVDSALRARLGEYRPELPGRDRAVLSAALLSVLSSIGDHHVAIPVRALTEVLGSACRALIDIELPAPADDTETTTAREIPLTFKHELLLVRAVELFHERGYPNVSVEDIATAAGLPASSAVYRFYRGKGDILAAAFRRAADRVSAAIGPAVAGSDGPRQALHTLIDLFVDGSFAERELTFVYYAEISNVPAEERAVLRNIQRLNVEEWAKLLMAARPELAAPAARVLVHAALAMVVDLGQRFGSVDPACSRRRVAMLMRQVLFGR
ncbi:TetR family transcriptional regulator [Nocardia cyriacigeorgica]|uniref:TetR family transcriptional regulator n=1 Tax=Nocardia cyriacigeorgica TaxID=135487 RepID=A0A6P1DA79_9NOCA|nr:TetR family transcriptional regulator [Nocardia cyriacigeorgica]NEW41878.1 TetR family transcriptional regulator [Nocardia cyriacigeorgica]NEW46144.1 TetR family transcriptional regulator [Nocardia cyriacigeorgica]NEW52242.1 TetR family transcriptional regulator [Nocardia cyriacigeorgica]NEW57600.1 TetR family transcriptional regulator [Nocardia cyriacigeorgica]